MNFASNFFKGILSTGLEKAFYEYFSIRRFIYQLLGKAPSGKTEEKRTSLFILETPVLGPNWLLNKCKE